MSSTALIIGITGQDGSYLTEQLLAKGYDIRGLTRSPASTKSKQLKQIVAPLVLAPSQFCLEEVDYADSSALIERIVSTNPDEIYNLAAQSHVGKSFNDPLTTLDINSRLPLTVLEAGRRLQQMGNSPRIYQACSSEMFGRATSCPQTETTRFEPQSPYACSKVYAFHQTVNYRETYGLFACNGILYNHESPRRPAEYVTRKITQSVARIAAGQQDVLELGNLNVGRDWGFAGDYADAMWRMLKHDSPDDYIVATNQWHSLEDFLNAAFEYANLDWHDYVVQKRELMRPAEVSRLQGDYSKARNTLGWKPTIAFAELVSMMVEADIAQWDNASVPPTVEVI